MEQDRQLRRKVAAMEAALNERLAAMKSSERELQLKEAALLEANDIARKAQELERQCATMRAATPGSSPPASTQGVSLAWAYAGLQPLSVAGASPMQRATLSPPFAWLGSEESQAPVTPPRAAATRQ